MSYPKKTTNGIWSATVKGDLKGRFYTFRINDLRKSDVKQNVPANRKNYLEETPGVFAKAVSINGKRGGCSV